MHYFDCEKWEITKERPEGKSIRLKMPLSLLVAPIMGLIFVMFLPAIGFVLLAKKLIA